MGFFNTVFQKAKNVVKGIKRTGSNIVKGVKKTAINLTKGVKRGAKFLGVR